MFSRLAYVSIVKPDTSHHLRKLLTHWRARNHMNQITGALCLYEDVFLQCIEGPQDAVDETFFKIDRDPRHDRVRVLYRQEAARRLFPGFRLGLLTWNPDTTSLFRSFLGSGDLHAAEPRAAVDLIEARVLSLNLSEI